MGDILKSLKYILLNLTSLAQLDVENCLVGLEDHTCIHIEIFVEVQPSAIGAGLVVRTICKFPVALIRQELDAGLILGQKLVVDSDVTVWGTADNDALFSEILLVVVDLTGRGASEDLKLKLDAVVVGLYIEVGRDVELLCSLSIDIFLVMLLKILITI